MSFSYSYNSPKGSEPEFSVYAAKGGYNFDFELRYNKSNNFYASEGLIRGHGNDGDLNAIQKTALTTFKAWYNEHFQVNQ